MPSIDRFYIGLATTFHDPAVAIVSESGEVVFAEAVERPLQSRRAYFQPPDDLVRFPALVAAHCGKNSRLVVATSWSGGPKMELPVEDGRVSYWPERIGTGMRTSLANAASQATVNLGFADALRLRGDARAVRLVRFDHHLTHAAAACLTGPFDEAVCAVVDGYGEHGANACFRFERGALSALPRATSLGSLGLFYSTVCALAGFDPVEGEEWKVMGLAPYGRRDDALHALLRPTLRVSGIDLLPGCTWVDYMRRVDKARAHAEELRRAERGAADVARTGQEIFEEVMTELLANVYALGLSENLVLGGGCALNSSFNGRIPEVTPFRAPHVCMAPADDGNALGAALLAWRTDHPDAPFRPGALASPYLGSRASPDSLRRARELGGLRVDCAPEEVTDRCAQLLADGKIVGWFRGRAEFGPRALGNRSILADPRSAAMKDRLNHEVKRRESFRPFAPSILAEQGPAYFEGYVNTPYMERALRFRPDVRDRVPAVVHEGGTGRLQSVTAASNPAFHALLTAFHARTGIPLLLQTSFNVMGKPIVHSVEDALATFFTTGMDALAIEDSLFVKERRDA